MEWHFDVSGPLEADVSVPAGQIEVRPTADGTVAVELQILRPGRRGEDLLAESDVTLTDGHLQVRVPDQRFDNTEVHCSVSLPEHSSLRTRSASSDVRCTAVLARFDGTTASGDIRLDTIDDGISIKTASGDIRCTRVGGSIQVRAASGDLVVEHAQGEVDVSMASGDLDIGIADTSVTVKSASGGVRIGSASTGRIQVTSASGDVVVGVASGVGAYLDVTSVSGDTKSTLPFTEGAAAGGTLEIVCRTVSGDVSIRKASS